jgi:hypothetical protein
MSELEVLEKQYKFEFPNQQSVDEMPLIDLRRKILRWCNKSQGAIEPCRACANKCSAGIRAISLYDGIDAPKASEPSSNNFNTEEKVAGKEKENSEEVKTEKNKVGKPLSKWYEDAIGSGDPVEWCVSHLGITVKQAKKRIYMYEYNRFGAKGTKQTESPENKKHVAKSAPDPIAKTDDSASSLVDMMQSEMQTLTKKQEECRAQIDMLTEKHKNITDRIEAIAMCIELYKEKLAL